MIEIYVVVRELGKSKCEYWRKFRVPSLPRPGDYISMHKPDKVRGEDLIVRHVWWRLGYPEESGSGSEEAVGALTEIFVECDTAVGPYASDAWRERVERARRGGIEITEFEVQRLPLFGSDV